MGWPRSGRALLVGLGNPGPTYADTRHNIGFMLIDRLAEQAGVSVTRSKFSAFYEAVTWKGRALVLLKPQTFMNLSGHSVKRAQDFFEVPPEATVVMHDDIDLLFGDVRVKIGGGHGGHNGLRSIVQETGSPDFVRVRLGVGRPRGSSDVTGHVLGRFGSDERIALDDVMTTSLRGLETIFEEGPKAAMNAVNGLFRGKPEGS